MKKTIILISAIAGFAAALSTTSCSTTTTDSSYKMAEQGNTVLSYSARGKDAQAAKAALLDALQKRKWLITSSDYPITAQLENRGQSAKLSITYADGNILIQTKGSQIDGKAYVPVRYVDFLMKTVYKEL